MAKFLIQSVPAKLQIRIPFIIKTIVLGQVIEGVLKPGMKVELYNRIMEIQQIEMNHKKIEESHPHDEIALIIKNGNETILRSLEGKEIEFL